MSERFTRVFKLPSELYAENSPVVVSAGALLKDNLTSNIIAQLKITNITDKVIKAAIVKLQLFDTAGAKLDSEVKFEYLDLSAKRNEEFGSKTAIPVPDATARCFSVIVDKVVFADNSIYTYGGEPYESLKPKKGIEVLIQDDELLKQYKIEFGRRCDYQFVEDRDLWRCCCGFLCKKQDERCPGCGLSYNALKNLDLSVLESKKKARLAEQARIAEEERLENERQKQIAKEKMQKALKTAKKVSYVVIPVICLIIAFVILNNKVFIPNKKYNEAVELLNNKQYVEAKTAFEALDGHKDSEDMIKECRYLIATDLLNGGKFYSSARKMFNELGEYKDSKELALECRYQSATDLMNQGSSYSGAQNAFKELGDYKDSKELANECGYKSAVQQFEIGAYYEAARKFSELGDYKDSKTRMEECYKVIREMEKAAKEKAEE